MKFVTHRDRTLASAMGLSIKFEKGVPTHVPPYMYKEALAIGAVPEDELTEDDLVSGNPNEPREPTAREAALFKAFETMILRNTREEFTAGGTPVSSVLATQLGWTVPTKERDIAWAKFKVGAKD